MAWIQRVSSETNDVLKVKTSSFFIRNLPHFEEIIFIVEKNISDKAKKQHVIWTTRARNLTLRDMLKLSPTNFIQVVMNDWHNFHFYLSTSHTRKYRRSYLWFLICSSNLSALEVIHIRNISFYFDCTTWNTHFFCFFVTM